MSAKYDAYSSDDNDSSDGELEVVVVACKGTASAADSTAAAAAPASRRLAKSELLSLAGPQLSATGGVPADPYSIDDDDDNDEDDDDVSVLSLKSRLRLRTKGEAAAADEDGVGVAAADFTKGSGAVGASARKSAAAAKGATSMSSSRPAKGRMRPNHPQEVLVLSSDSESGGESDDGDDIFHRRTRNSVSKREGTAAAAALAEPSLSLRPPSKGYASSQPPRPATNSQVRHGEADESDSSSSDDEDDDRGRSGRGTLSGIRSVSNARQLDDDDSSTSSSDCGGTGTIRTDQRGTKVPHSTSHDPSRRDLLPPRPPAAVAAATLASRKRPVPSTAAPGKGGGPSLSSIDDYQAKKLQMQRDLESKRLKRLGISCDSDDSDTTTTSAKPSSKRKPGGASGAAAAKEDREQARREKAERKRVAEEFRLKEMERKERERLAKRVARDAERASKEQNTVLARQAAGRNAKQEIAVLMDPGLYHHETNLYCQELQDLDYHVVRFESLLGCHAIQWIRKDATEGGAEDAVRQLYGQNPQGYTHLHTLCVVFDDPNEFVRLLERRRSDNGDDGEDDIEDDFPALEKWLRGVETGWRQSWNCPAPARPRVVLLLHKVPQQLVVLRRDFQARRNGVTRLPPSSEELNDALAWLTVEFRVECVHCSEHKYVNWEIAKITRLLSEEPYQKVYADFDCIAKLPRNCPVDAPPYEHAISTWMNQVQQLDGISFDKARVFVRHYPTARSLWRAYKSNDLSVDEKQLLVADLFGDHRREVKASTQLYRLFTTTDPNEIL